MNKSQSTGMYVILGIMILAFVSMLFSGPTTNTQELTYTNFVQKVENGEIKSVEMDKEFLIAQPLKQPEQTEKEKKAPKPIYGELKKATLQYKVLIPQGSDILTKLEENNVIIEVKKPSESSQILNVLGSLILPLLFIIFLIIMARGLSAGGSQAMSFGKRDRKSVV